MLRVVVVAVVVIVAWLLLLKLFHQIKEARIDWTGIAAFIGFIALAFYLRHATGLG
ncbi:hypothetical protein [Aminobacter sp. AP02]|uniref:hypothetical protein n=1 Tax=Aminobacter sp. AP02 TaxID=2135737 RepID=UPI000D7B7B67|nr:hypothetical protein [Aminobacter sp. AP02]PWK66932.1 hypothetical protein C8K44_11347 [Aminobacter sp. AP02]